MDFQTSDLTQGVSYHYTHSLSILHSMGQKNTITHDLTQGMLECLKSAPIHPLYIKWVKKKLVNQKILEF